MLDHLKQFCEIPPSILGLYMMLQGMQDITGEDAGNDNYQPPQYPVTSPKEDNKLPDKKPTELHSEATEGDDERMPDDWGNYGEPEPKEDDDIRQPNPNLPQGRPADTPEEKEAVSQQIGNGHAWDKHKDEFPEIKNPEEFADFIGDIMNNPSEQKDADDGSGRRAYWDDATNTIVIEDPSSQDSGTAFRPDLGKDFFDMWPDV